MTIFVLTQLPSITDQVYLHGSLDTVIDGSRSTLSSAYGLFVYYHDGSVLSSLTVRAFPQCGVVLYSGAYHVLRGLHVYGNAVDGVQVLAPHALFVDNTVHSNTRIGFIAFTTALNATFYNNTVGLDLTGRIAMPNLLDGMQTQGAGSTIGGPLKIHRNTISGNGRLGALVSGRGISVINNFFGTDVTGEMAVGNRNGMYVTGAAVRIEKNTVSGNIENGIQLMNIGGIIVGNRIGTNVAGLSAVPNGLDGVYVEGDLSFTAGNVISGNGRFGFTAVPSSGVFTNNFVGVDVTGAVALPNRVHGMKIIGISWNVTQNLFSGNLGTGAVLECPNVRFLGNIVGLDSFGKIPIPNNIGVYIASDNMVIGGTTPLDTNSIAGNSFINVAIESANVSLIGNRVGLNFEGAGFRRIQHDCRLHHWGLY
jgi:hypothetical protein